MKRYMFIYQIDDMRYINSPGDNLCDYYLIDRNCRIFSEYSGIELKQIITENGYKAVSLNTKSGKRIQRRVHRLGMLTFKYFPGCENFQVHHKDGEKFNNSIDTNLQWVSPKENIEYAINDGLKNSWRGELNPNAIISESDVLNIIDMVISGLSNEDIIDILPYTTDNIINDIIYGNTWKNIVNNETVQIMKSIRKPQILSVDQKHMICNSFQNNPLVDKRYGMTRQYLINTLQSLNIPINESTIRMSKRLFYKYQDDNITCLYNY